MFVDQWIYGAYLRSLRDDRLSSRVGRRLWPALRRRRAGAGYCHAFHGHKLFMPMSHDLPIHEQMHPAYGLNLRELAVRVGQKYPGFAAVDVGANVGDTALHMLDAGCAQLLCVEADPVYFDYLRRNLKKRDQVRLAQVLLGAQEGQLPCALHSAGGTARLVSGSSVLAVRTLDQVLDFGPVRLLKVDTDGYDLEILQGAEQVLRRDRPVLFFEYDPYFFDAHTARPLQVLERLREWGYTRFTAYENTGQTILSASTDDLEILAHLDGWARRRRPGVFFLDYAFWSEADADLVLQPVGRS